MSRFARRFGIISVAIIGIGTAVLAAGPQAKSGVPAVLPHSIRPHLIVGSPSPMPSPIFSPGPPQHPILHGAGVAVPEPSMAAQPPNIGYQRAPTQTPNEKPAHHGLLNVAQLSTRLDRSHNGHHVKNEIVNTTSPPVTGINHWWAYEEDGIPGIGKYMINVGTGNLLVQADDMAIPNKGIELAFRRTYNSLSQHDYANTDGSVPSNYGDGWTNTFDAHVSPNSNSSWSVYDIDGARYDYGVQIPGSNPACYTPPTGQFASLCSDGSNGLYWTKKTGTVYYFFTGSGGVPVFAGRLHEIFGRHHNNYLLFQYFVDAGKPYSYLYLNKITVTTEANAVATLRFGDVTIANVTYRELTSLQFPDSPPTTVNYAYAQTYTGASLGEVDEPGNGSTTGSIPQQYAYAGRLGWVSSPRWVTSSGADGMQLEFSFTGPPVMLQQVMYTGNMDPMIPSFTNGAPSSVPASQIQTGSTPIPSTPYLYRTVTVAYTTTGFENCASGSSATDWSDTDGHHTAYCMDSSQRVVESHEFTGDPVPGPSYLPLEQFWDSSNDLVATTDPRGNETNYAYDAVGNTIAVAAPATNGFRATSLYSYDVNNNLISYCDPVWANDPHNHADWNPPASPPTCPQKSGVTLLGWSPPVAGVDPFGELTSITTPLGYTRQIAYTPLSSQGGNDYGLPVSVTGTAITQADNTVRTPTQIFNYDANGNLICYSKGVGTWALQYDSGGLGRNIAIADPDDGTAFSHSQCNKTSNGNIIVAYKQYYPDGSIQYDETPLQRSLDTGKSNFYNAHAFTYDQDGNQLTKTTQFGNQAGDKLNFYDGADRMVEDVEPYDPRTFTSQYPNTGGSTYDGASVPWVTRYIYDLTQGGTVSLAQGTSSFAAYGNLYSTRQYSGSAYFDTKGNAYDALDRVTTKYEYPPSSRQGAPQAVDTLTYDADASGNYFGTLRSDCNSIALCKTFVDDAMGRTTSITFNDVTPNRTIGYDADSRTTSVTSTGVGTQGYAYDADGRVISSVEAHDSTQTDPTTLTYTYYLDGAREYVSVAPEGQTGFTAPNMLQYSYRVDGLIQTKAVAFPYNGGTQSNVFAWLYSPAGRISSRTDGTQSAPSSLGAIGATYDATGELKTSTIPAGTYSEFQRDPEGEVTSEAAMPVVGNKVTMALTLSARGEVLQGDDSNSRSQADDGVLIGQSVIVCQTCFYDTAWYENGAVHDLNDALVKIVPPQPGCLSNCDAESTYSYDTNGRQTSASQTYLVKGSKPPSYATGTYQRGYDAENHIISQEYSGWPTSFYQLTGRLITSELGYTWGPNGHPALVGTAPSGPLAYDTLHWNGDSLLFETDSNGNVDGVFIDKLAAITKPGTGPLTVFDRGPGGSVVSNHNNHAQYSGWYMEDIFGGGFSAPLESASSGYVAGATALANVGAVGSGVGGGLVMNPMLPDGITDGTNTIQGVRSYDPALGTWTTPDAFAGEVGDPMSQKSYMWNRNDPIAYADPSGFYSEIVCADGKDCTAEGAKKAKMVKKNAGIAADYAHSQFLKTGDRNWQIKERVFRQLEQDMTPNTGSMIITIDSRAGLDKMNCGNDSGCVDINNTNNVHVGDSGVSNDFEGVLATEAMNSEFQQTSSQMYGVMMDAVRADCPKTCDDDKNVDRLVNQFLSRQDYNDAPAVLPYGPDPP